MLDDEDEDVLGGKDHTQEDMGEDSASDDEDESASSASSSDGEFVCQDFEDMMAEYRGTEAEHPRVQLRNPTITIGGTPTFPF